MLYCVLAPRHPGLICVHGSVRSLSNNFYLFNVALKVPGTRRFRPPTAFPYVGSAFSNLDLIFFSLRVYARSVHQSPYLGARGAGTYQHCILRYSDEFCR